MSGENLRQKELLSLCVGFCFALVSCSDGVGRNFSDEELFELVSTTTDYTYYLDSSDRFVSQGGPHQYVAIKFNSLAAAALDSSGVLPEGEEFPTGSLIVKESYVTSSGDLNVYAVMYKNDGDQNAVDDWIWAEFTSTGEPYYEVSKKGLSCVSCHAQEGNRDYARIFSLYP